MKITPNDARTNKIDSLLAVNAELLAALEDLSYQVQAANQLPWSRGELLDTIDLDQAYAAIARTIPSPLALAEQLAAKAKEQS